MKRYIRSQTEFEFDNSTESIELMETILIEFFGVSEEALNLAEDLCGTEKKTLCDVLYIYGGYRDFDQLYGDPDFDDFISNYVESSTKPRARKRVVATTNMNPETYFKRYGYIYGDSYKWEFGRWHHDLHKFTDWDEAQKWLNTEEHDFRERELISKTEAVALGWKDWMGKDLPPGYDPDYWE